MNVLGMGIVFARGNGTDSFQKALNEGWRAPEETRSPYSLNKKSFAYLVDPASAADKALMRKMRRADRLSKMAVAAASEALAAGGIDDINKKSVGIITATALGAHVTTFDFLNDILEYGEANVSPTTFSNSVHNAAASYISSALGIEGPTLTVTQFFFSFQCAMQLAQSWLMEGRCDYILVGAVEQYGDVLAYIHEAKLTAPSDGRIRPFNFKPAFQVPGEGSVFFLVSREKTEGALCSVDGIQVNNDGDTPAGVDLNIIDADGLLADESIYRQSLSADIPAAAYSPLFGSMMTGSAFNFAAGALMLGGQMLYANPVSDNPHGLHIAGNTGPHNIELIRCIRYNCYGNKAVIYLSKCR